MMWLFSGTPDDPEDDTWMKTHCAEALYTAVKSVMYAMQTADDKAQQAEARRLIQIAMPWTIRRWSESKLANGKPPIQIPMENTHLIDLQWTADGPVRLKNFVERYTSWGASAAWRVYT